MREKKRMGWRDKHRLYYDKVIGMHFNQGLGYLKISKIVPVSKSGICRWITNFTAENENQYPKVMRKKASRSIEQSIPEASYNRVFQDKIAGLELQFRKEKLRADVYDMMIDITEKKFNIPMRKKAGSKQ